MTHLADMSLQRKLTVVILSTCVVALFLACTGFVAMDRLALRRSAVASLTTLAEVTGHNSAAAVVFGDEDFARVALGALQAQPEVVAAALYTKTGKKFAQYAPADSSAPILPGNVPMPGHRFFHGNLEVCSEIISDGQVVGRVFLRSDLRRVHAQMRQYAWIVLVVLIASSLLAWLLSARLRRMVSEPIVSLERVARRVTEQNDYSLRAQPGSGDETGVLISAFNRMLSVVQERDAKLLEANADLERRVLERTAALEMQLSIRRKGEADLEQSLALQMATLESTTDGILVVNNEGRIVTWNQKFATMWGIPAAVLAKRDDSQAMGSVVSQLKDPESFIAKVRELYAQRAMESYDIFEFRDGRIFERYSQPYRIAGEVEGRVWSFRDITSRRHAEEALRQSEDRLRQAQKMDAVGRLAGGIAHDFNNILTVINGYADLLVRRAAPDDPDRKFLEEINEAGNRAAELTRRLLAFSRKQVLQPRHVNLGQIVTGLEQMLRRLIGEHIELTTTPDTTRAVVMADPGQVEQVILNLAVNARDAMPNGGRLAIHTADVIITPDTPTGHVPIPPGAYVLLSVVDTGVGMTPEVQAHLFEPFFTTKGLGKGTGLGLATCYGIVHQSGGEIRITSEPGRGTTVNIYLPQVAVPTAGGTGEKIAPDMPPGTETILLVEDEPALRELAGTVLRDCGYRVLEAGNGRDAIAVIEQPATPAIQLLLTDVIMPHTGGKELATRMKHLRPDCRVLFMSGYTDDALGDYGLTAGEFAFLEKPFSPSGLARKVRSVLDHNGARN